MADEVNKKISSILREVSKTFGEGSAMILGDENYNFDIERISSGSLNLDLALGGGMPKGRIIEVYGQPSSGKTTITILHAVEVQRKIPDKYILFVDLEHTVDKALFESYGLNSNRIIIVQPDTAEEAFDIMEMFIRSGTISLAIMDSVSAILPKEEADKDMGSQQMGLVARLMGKALRKLTPIVSNTETSIIFINQIREKIGVMYGKNYNIDVLVC